jgi:hypothetical protein
MRTDDTVTRADLVPQADTADPTAAEPSGTPAGMLAGESKQDLREEDAARDALEGALRGQPGSWKSGGAVPDHAPAATATSSAASRPNATRSSSG